MQHKKIEEKVDTTWDGEMVKYIDDYLYSLGFEREVNETIDNPECEWIKSFYMNYVMKLDGIDLVVATRTDFKKYINTYVTFLVDINEKNEVIIYRELNEINKLMANYGVINDNKEICIMSHLSKQGEFQVENDWKRSVDKSILEAKKVYYRIKYPKEKDENILLLAKGWR